MFPTEHSVLTGLVAYVVLAWFLGRIEFFRTWAIREYRSYAEHSYRNYQERLRDHNVSPRRLEEFRVKLRSDLATLDAVLEAHRFFVGDKRLLLWWLPYLPFVLIMASHAAYERMNHRSLVADRLCREDGRI